MDRRRFLASSGSALPLAVAGCSGYLRDNAIAVADWNDLNEIRKNTDGSYRLTADIGAETAGYDEHVQGGWRPIAAQTDAFSGTFDGKGHTVSELVVERPESNSAGLFGSNIGEITALVLADCTVTGGKETGMLVGENYSGGTVERITASGSVYGIEKVGGIVGWSEDGTIRQARAAGTVEGQAKVGGIVGANRVDADIAEVSAESHVTGKQDVGGVAGWNSGFGDILSSSALGVIEGTKRVGGLVGHNKQGGILDRSFASTETNGDSAVGALVGRNAGTISDVYYNADADSPAIGDGDSNGTALDAEQMNGETAPTAMEGFDFDSTWTVVTNPPAYPVHRWR